MTKAKTTKTTKPAPVTPEPAQTVLDTARAVAQAKAVLDNPDVQTWYEETVEFLAKHLGQQHPDTDRSDLAGLTFLSAGMAALRVQAGLPPE